MIHGQGEMEQTAAGAKRESNKGRGRFDLIPFEAMERLAIWYEQGAEKYAERNWEQGLSVKDCVNRMVRHALKVASGRTDEDHLAAVMWNAAAIITMQARKPELDDHCWHYPEGVVYQSPTAEKVEDLSEKLKNTIRHHLSDIDEWHNIESELRKELNKPNIEHYLDFLTNFFGNGCKRSSVGPED